MQCPLLDALYDSGQKAVKTGKDRPFLVWSSVQRKSCLESSELVDFAIGLVNAVLNLPNKQVKFLAEFKLQKKNCNHSYSSRKTDFLWTLWSYNLFLLFF